MKMDKEKVAIYCAAWMQGMLLVIFPAMSTFLLQAEGFNLTPFMYGSLFIPQVLIALMVLALNPFLTRTLGSKAVFALGLLANGLAMILFAVSKMKLTDPQQAYMMLLGSTGLIGLGFGLSMPTFNSICALLNPKKTSAFLLILMTLLGIGATVAPLLANLFVQSNAWWQLPALLAFLLFCLFLLSLTLKLPGGKIHIEPTTSRVIIVPTRLGLFAAFALFYGIIETLSGNWLSIYMSQSFGASFEKQSLALTTFWGSITLGRLLYGIESLMQKKWTFQLFPFLVASAFFIFFSLNSQTTYWPFVASGLLGFGCSLLLPLAINFANKQLDKMTFYVPIVLICFYLVGYIIATCGVGALVEYDQISLHRLYSYGAIIAVLMGLLALLIVQTEKNDSLTKRAEIN
jgi:MFS family permease